MARVATRPRPGYTLLEVLLATTIALFLLGGLYVALDVQLRQMDEGRTVVEQSTVSRSIIARITNDLAPSLGPVAPVISSSTSSASSAGANGAGTAGTTGATTEPADATEGSTMVFQVGVKGDASSVSIFTSQLTRSNVATVEDASGNIPAPESDIRRVTYFLLPEGGLARQTLKQVTAEQVDSTPTEADEFTQILADEVKELSFRYFDGTAWQESWDGSTAGPDGKTPQGPPRAIEVTVAIQLPGVEQLKKFVHVIALPTGPGPAATTSTSP